MVNLSIKEVHSHYLILITLVLEMCSSLWLWWCTLWQICTYASLCSCDSIWYSLRSRFLWRADYVFFTQCGAFSLIVKLFLIQYSKFFCFITPYVFHNELGLVQIFAIKLPIWWLFHTKNDIYTNAYRYTNIGILINVHLSEYYCVL